MRSLKVVELEVNNKDANEIGSSRRDFVRDAVPFLSYLLVVFLGLSITPISAAIVVTWMSSLCVLSLCMFSYSFLYQRTSSNGIRVHSTQYDHILNYICIDLLFKKVTF